MARYRRRSRGAQRRFRYDPTELAWRTSFDAESVELLAGSAWTAENAGVTTGDLIFNGAGTTKLVSTAGDQQRARGSGTWDLSAHQFLDFWAHFSSSDSFLNGATGSQLVVYAGDSTLTNYYISTQTLHIRPSVDGWRSLRLHKNAFTVGAGAPSWASIARFRVWVEAADATSGTVHLGPVRAGRQEKAVGRLYFDDGHETVHQYAFPAMQERGLVGVAGIITSFVGAAGYMTWSQIRDLADAGWDIVSHTHTHQDLTTLTAEQVESECSLSASALVAQGYRMGARCLVAPFGRYHNATDVVARNYFDVVRGGAPAITAGVPMEVFPAPHPRDHRFVSVANTDAPASVIADLDAIIAAGGTWCPTWHKFTTGVPGTALDYNTADFETILDHVVTQRDAGDLELRLMTNPWFR